MQESAREFAMREVLPVANRLDPQQGHIPMELREKLAEMGYSASSSRRNMAAHPDVTLRLGSSR